MYQKWKKFFLIKDCRMTLEKKKKGGVSMFSLARDRHKIMLFSHTHAFIQKNHLIALDKERIHTHAHTKKNRGSGRFFFNFCLQRHEKNKQYMNKKLSLRAKLKLGRKKLSCDWTILFFLAFSARKSFSFLKKNGAIIVVDIFPHPQFTIFKLQDEFLAFHSVDMHNCATFSFVSCVGALALLVEN